MVTINLKTGEVTGEFDRGDEIVPDFEERGIDYVIEDEITFFRDETPDFVYNLLPRFDEFSTVKLTVGETAEHIWITELEEDELVMWFCIPLSWKEEGRPFGFGLRDNQETLDEIAEGIS